MSGPLPLPGDPTPATDADADADDVAPGVEDLPDDIPNDDLTPQQPPVAVGAVPDTDVDAPVLGTPPTDADIEG